MASEDIEEMIRRCVIDESTSVHQYECFNWNFSGPWKEDCAQHNREWSRLPLLAPVLYSYISSGDLESALLKASSIDVRDKAPPFTNIYQVT